MPRSLLFKMFITIGLQVNTYYSVTLCDINVQAVVIGMHSSCTALS